MVKRSLWTKSSTIVTWITWHSFWHNLFVVCNSSAKILMCELPVLCFFVYIHRAVQLEQTMPWLHKHHVQAERNTHYLSFVRPMVALKKNKMYWTEFFHIIIDIFSDCQLFFIFSVCFELSFNICKYIDNYQMKYDYLSVIKPTIT